MLERAKVRRPKQESTEFNTTGTFPNQSNGTTNNFPNIPH
jgi:hypothetical protein